MESLSSFAFLYQNPLFLKNKALFSYLCLNLLFDPDITSYAHQNYQSNISLVT
jgi:hypothetical protein